MAWLQCNMKLLLECTFKSVYFCHNNFDRLVHCVYQLLKVVKQGENEDQFWETFSTTAQEQVDAFAPSDKTVQQDNIPAGLFASSNCVEDIAQAHNQGFQVDNDKDPTPEIFQTHLNLWIQG